MTVDEFKETASLILKNIEFARAGQRFSSNRDIKVEFLMNPAGSEALPSLLPLICEELDFASEKCEVIQVRFDVVAKVLAPFAHWGYPDSGGGHVREVIGQARNSFPCWTIQNELKSGLLMTASIGESIRTSPTRKTYPLRSEC